MARRKNSVARKPAPAPAPLPRNAVLAGVVRALGEDGMAAFTADDGTELQALCAQPRRAWLTQALKVGPVTAYVVCRGRAGLPALLGELFPGPEHVAVVADVNLRARRLRVEVAEAAELRVQRSSIQLTPEAVAVRGRTIRSVAAGLNRIKGATTKVN